MKCAIRKISRQHRSPLHNAIDFQSAVIFSRPHASQLRPGYHLAVASLGRVSVVTGNASRFPRRSGFPDNFSIWRVLIVFECKICGPRTGAKCEVVWPTGPSHFFVV